MPARRPTPSRSLNASRPSWKKAGEIWCAAAVELAKDWRKDKYLRQLQALLLVADIGHTLVLTGTGDVIEPDDGVAAIGSGGPYALAAARALVRRGGMEPEEIAREAMSIAAEICVFTNDHVTLEKLEIPGTVNA